MLERNLLAEKKGRMINTWPCASQGNAPKKRVGSQDYRRGRIAFWPTLPMPARQGEVSVVGNGLL
jgi:hypothetical protein